MHFGISHEIARPSAIILGVILILTGRRLFWLFIATAGFFVGASFAGMFFAGPSGRTRSEMTGVSGSTDSRENHLL